MAEVDCDECISHYVIVVKYKRGRQESVGKIGSSRIGRMQLLWFDRVQRDDNGFESGSTLFRKVYGFRYHCPRILKSRRSNG